jgi:phosphohistidine phosphatase
MIVYFVRHANAGQTLQNPKRDARRPLDQLGIEQATLMGRALASADIQVDEVISSPLKRATQSASLMANELGFDGKIVYSTALAKETDFAQFRQLLRKHSRREAIMLVGHNPSLSQYLSLLLTGGASDQTAQLKKGSVARVEVGSRDRAVLHWCLTPRLVRSIYDSVASSSRPKTVRK